MQTSSYHSQRLATSVFFVAPALVYGIFTSRLPALKASHCAQDAQIALMLLALGCATLMGLVCGGFLLARVRAANMLAISVFGMTIAITLAAWAPSIELMTAFCALTGLAVGFCDVAMNAQGIALEQKYHSLCLSFLHGMSSAGAVAGSLAASLSAALGLSPFLNLLLILGPFLALVPFAWRVCYKIGQEQNLHEGQPAPKTTWRRIGFVVYICGLLSLLCHVAEGSAGEWGSILLHSVKGASEQEAGLVFAAFTAAMVGCRFAADRLRLTMPDQTILIRGSLLASLGLAAALASPWPAVCLIGFACMGAGLAPVVPILFSRAGAAPGVSPAQASTVVSVFSYIGLLVFPPFLGFLGHAAGLATSLWLVDGLCVALAIGCFAIPRK